MSAPDRPFWMRIGRLSPWLARVLAPGYGRCLRCHITWRFVTEHSTMYTEHYGCFPLCQRCWAELTPEQRIPYYYKLITRWFTDYEALNGEEFDETWAQVRSAVMAGG